METALAADTNSMGKSAAQGAAFIVGGGLLAVYGVFHGDHANAALIFSGAALASVGLLRLRPRRQSSTAPTRMGLALVGGVLAAAGLVATFAPIVLLVLHRWELGAVTFVGLLVGPYFSFLGYVMLWGATVGTEPPLAKRFGALIRKSSTRLMRPL